MAVAKRKLKVGKQILKGPPGSEAPVLAEEAAVMAKVGRQSKQRRSLKRCARVEPHEHMYWTLCFAATNRLE